jgi:putative polymerase
MKSAAFSPRSESAARRPALRLLPGFLVVAAVTFNAVLAIINAHVMPLGSAHVIAAEALLVTAVHVVALANYRQEMTPWYALIVILVFIAVGRSLFFGQIEPKYLRDVLLIPTFIILGLTFDERRLTTVVVSVHTLVLAVLVLEAAATSAYSDLFRIQDYYINTRGYDVHNFWNRSSDLYVSAVRPDSRTFDFVDLHRLSSIFLEPVSLGNYCIIIVAFLCTRYRMLGLFTRWFLILGTFLALIGCDGRLAAASSIFIVAAAFVAPRLPRWSALIYLPAATIVAYTLVWFGGFHGGPDNFTGRVAHTVDLLQSYDLVEFLGMSDRYLDQAVDSGLAYLITTQSILGTAILWVFIICGSFDKTREQIRYTHAICIYLAMTLMVSFAFLSIKTAALLWFIHGVLQTQGWIRERASWPQTTGTLRAMSGNLRGVQAIT